jgi:hypothetical protein
MKSIERRQTNLLVERQNFFRPTCFKMQKSPDAPEEIPSLCQSQKVLPGEKAPIRQVLQCWSLVPGHAGPADQMEIPHPSLTSFDVGLQEIDRLSELCIVATALLNLLLDELLTPRPTTSFAYRRLNS